MTEFNPREQNEHNLRFGWTWNEAKRFMTYALPVLRHGTPRKYLNALRLEWEYLSRRPSLGARPYILKIDPTNICNLRCVDCYTGQLANIRPRGQMALETFRRIVDQTKSSVFKILLYGWGESFLVKDIYKMIRYASDRNIGVAISSNMSLSEEHFRPEEVIASGLEVLTISWDGLEPATSQAVRPGSCPDLIRKNVEAVVKAKKDSRSFFPLLEWQFLVHKGNQHEIPSVRKLARGLGINYVRFNPHMKLDPYQSPVANRVLAMPADRSNYVRSGCSWPYRTMVVNWNGDVSPCCYFIATDNPELSYGNMARESFDAVWNNKSYVQTRRFVQAGKTHPNDIPIPCYKCSLSFKEGVKDKGFLNLNS